MFFSYNYKLIITIEDITMGHHHHKNETPEQKQQSKEIAKIISQNQSALFAMNCQRINAEIRMQQNIQMTMLSNKRY